MKIVTSSFADNRFPCVVPVCRAYRLHVSAFQAGIFSGAAKERRTPQQPALTHASSLVHVSETLADPTRAPQEMVGKRKATFVIRML